ncbi:MAG: Transposase [Pseudomonadota bacterium]|nr:Transposase [Pseudomonadota bacterium]
MTPPRKRRILTTQEKQKLLDELTKSQLSAEKFATKNGIGHSTLMRWRRESRVNAGCISSNGQLRYEARISVIKRHKE